MPLTSTSTPRKVVTGVWAIQHFWTESGHSLVLCSSRDRLEPIADELGIPYGDITDVSSSRAVVGLWGETLRAYQAHYHLERGG